MQRFALRLWSHRLTLPVVLGAVGLLMALSLAQQHQQWQTLLVDQSHPVSASTAPNRDPIDLPQVGQLFGAPAVLTKEPPRKTDLPLTLLGSFMNTRSERSAAVIQVSGHAARRVVVGQEIVSGVTLAAVSANHVVLRRGRNSEQLFFPRLNEQVDASKRKGQNTASSAFKAAQLNKLPAAKTDQRAQQKAAMLLQEMQQQREAGQTLL